MPHKSVKTKIRGLKARTLRLLLLRLYMYALATGNHKLKSKIEKVVGTSRKGRRRRGRKRRHSSRRKHRKMSKKALRKMRLRNLAKARRARKRRR